MIAGITNKYNCQYFLTFFNKWHPSFLCKISFSQISHIHATSSGISHLFMYFTIHISRSSPYKCFCVFICDKFILLFAVRLCNHYNLSSIVFFCHLLPHVNFSVSASAKTEYSSLLRTAKREGHAIFLNGMPFPFVCQLSSSRSSR